MRSIETSLLVFLSFSIVLWGCATGMTSTKKKAEVKERLGNSLVQEGKFQEGLKELLQAAELDPESAAIQNALGLAYQGLREFDKAISHYEKALELKRDFPEAQNNLGTVYASLGKWDTAILFFEKAADNVMYRTRYFAYHNLGSAYHRKGAYRKAIESYKRALEYFPGYGPAYDNMGLSHEALQEWELAIAAYKRSIEISADSPIPHLRLGGLYLKLNRQEDAAQELLATIRIDPTGPYGIEARKLLRQIRKTE